MTYYSRSYDSSGVAIPGWLLRDFPQPRTDIIGPVFTKIWDTPASGHASA